jgi:hypothetical protein
MPFFEEERFYKWSVAFIRLLMLFTLVATFEHCYHTLSTFSAGHYLWTIPVSLWAKALFVLTIDFGLYLGEWFIPQFKIRRIDTGLVQSMVIIFAIISAGLNVKYMIEFRPDDTLISYMIAWSIGLLIPVVLGVLGFIEGKVLMHRYRQSMAEDKRAEIEDVKIPEPKQNGVPEETKQMILQLRNTFNMPVERIASELGVPEYAVKKVLDPKL